MTSSRFLLLSLPCALAQSKFKQLQNQFEGSPSNALPQLQRAGSSTFANQIRSGLMAKPLAAPQLPSYAPGTSRVRSASEPARLGPFPAPAVVTAFRRSPVRPPPTGNLAATTPPPTVSTLTYKVDGAAPTTATSPTGLFVIDPTKKKIQGVDENLTKCTGFNQCQRAFDFYMAKYVSLGEAGLIAPTAKSGGGFKMTAKGVPILSAKQKTRLQQEHGRDLVDNKAVAAALLAAQEENTRNAYSVSIVSGGNSPTIMVSGTKFEVVNTEFTGTPTFTVEDEEERKPSVIPAGNKVKKVIWDPRTGSQTASWRKGPQKAPGPVVTLSDG